jgi:[ribosomal protein S5]-alanine N-acetyltransferase
MQYLLRPWQVSDAQSLQHYANNAAIAQFLTDKFPHPYSIQDAHSFIAFANKNSPFLIFAIEVNGEAIGGVGLHPQEDIMRKNAMLGY